MKKYLFVILTTCFAYLPYVNSAYHSPKTLFVPEMPSKDQNLYSDGNTKKTDHEAWYFYNSFRPQQHECRILKRSFEQIGMEPNAYEALPDNMSPKQFQEVLRIIIGNGASVSLAYKPGISTAMIFVKDDTNKPGVLARVSFTLQQGFEDCEKLRAVTEID